jgi:hypothetical protein
MANRQADENRPTARPDQRAGAKPGRHPLLGSMKGTVVVSEGYDLTRPLWLEEMEAAADRDEGEETE